MKKNFLVFLFSLMLNLSFSSPEAAGSSATSDGWEAGIATAIITPGENVWMGGYAARNRLPEGTLHDLWAKALALSDAEGNLALLITTDLMGFGRSTSDRIVQRITTELGLSRSQIILSSSHSHSGPVMMDHFLDMYPLEPVHLEAIDQYTEMLIERIPQLAGEAVAALSPSRLFAGNGVTRFQVNRRHNPESSIMEQSELIGPNDHSVPVIKITGPDLNLRAVVFGYACHPTTLNHYEISGDYPGFAQVELEERFPGITSFFFQGASGDQNPLPRRTVPLAVQYGRSLATAVERVLDEPMMELEPEFSGAYAQIDLPFAALPGQEELERVRDETTGFERRWAERQLSMLELEVPRITSYPYPVQVWRLGNQPLFVLGGEPVIAYTLELKKRFGNHVFVMGYANDVMGYIPDEIILREGGYEGFSSQRAYGLPAVWESGLERTILTRLEELARLAGISAVN